MKMESLQDFKKYLEKKISNDLEDLMDAFNEPDPENYDLDEEILKELKSDLELYRLFMFYYEY